LEDADPARHDRDADHGPDERPQERHVRAAGDEERVVEDLPDQQRVEDAETRREQDRAGDGEHAAAVRPEQPHDAGEDAATFLERDRGFFALEHGRK